MSPFNHFHEPSLTSHPDFKAFKGYTLFILYILGIPESFIIPTNGTATYYQAENHTFENMN